MALKREQTVSMFDSLKQTSTNNASKSEVKSPASEKPKQEPAEKTAPKAEEKKQEKEIKKASPSVEKKEDLKKAFEKKKAEPSTPVPEVKGLDFGIIDLKENKNVRKQFVFTKTQAAWIKETARINKISENKVIEQLIQMAMDM